MPQFRAPIDPSTSRIRAPGPFVILQGIPGDGRANTMDIRPSLPLPRLSSTSQTNDDDDNDEARPEEQRTLLDHNSILLNRNGNGTNLNATNDTRDMAMTMMMMMESNQDFIVIPDEAHTSDSSSRGRLASGTVPPNEQEQIMEPASNKKTAPKRTLDVNESWIHTSDTDDDDDDEEEMMQDAQPYPLSSTPTLMADDAAPADVCRHGSTMLLVDGHQLSNPTSAAADPETADALEAWHTKCRQTETFHRHEWLQSARQHRQNQMALNVPAAATASVTSQRLAEDEDLWWQCPKTHRLAVFTNVPSLHDKTMVSSLAPGTTVIGSKLVTLDSDTLVPVPGVDEIATTTTDSNHDSYRYHSHGQPGWTQVLLIESPCTGYIVLTRNGYPTALSGLPLQLCNPTTWLWMVTCPAGAVVRDGLDLSSPQLAILPYGSVVQVTRKVINAMGLSRLQVQVVNQDKSPFLMPSNLLTSATTIPTMFPVLGDASMIMDDPPPALEGWCSEYLNPLSGQRGAILQPIPLPCPVRYRVVLKQGAVLRSGVELSSPQIGHVPMGATVTVVSRKYSDHPTDRCIERFELAGNGGWMSCRLNKRPPEDFVVVEYMGLDTSFDANDAGRYHLQEVARVQQEQERQAVLAAASSILPTTSADMEVDDENCSSASAAAPTTIYTMSSTAASRSHAAANAPRDERCLICLGEERSATLVHGETGHIACCLLCARILKARSDPCPVCRLPIDMVIQHFWA